MTDDSLTDDAFLAALEDTTLPLTAFGHAAHLRAGYLYLSHCDFAEALARMRRSIKALASRHGRDDLYHETMTVAFMTLINERRATGHFFDWPSFLAQNQDLMRRDVLAEFYTRDRLSSALARKIFLLPDGGFRTTEAA